MRQLCRLNMRTFREKTPYLTRLDRNCCKLLLMPQVLKTGTGGSRGSVPCANCTVMLYLTLLLVGATAVTGLDGIGYGEEVPGSSAMRNLRRQTQITRNPCTCIPQSESCSCCGRVDQALINFHARGCGIVRYGSRGNRALRYEASLNNRTVNRTEATASKSPVELCVPAAIFMICTKFFDVEFQNATFTFCFRFDVKYSRFTLFSVDFDCVKVALAPGIASKHHLPENYFRGHK